MGTLVYWMHANPANGDHAPMARKTLFGQSPIEERLRTWHGEDWHTPKGRMIRDIVYAVDTGLITMVTFMAGVSISLPDTRHVMLAGLANAFSGMMAIFFSSFLSTKAQKDFFDSQIERERLELETMPEKERMEVFEILTDMGFSEEEALVGVKRITADHDTWLKFMVQEEIGLVPGTTDNPWEIGLVSAGSFVLGVIPPFLPFALGMPVHRALASAFGLVLAFMFTVGVVKTRLTKLHWLKSGIETVAVGAMTCGLGLVLGRVAALLMYSK